LSMMNLGMRIQMQIGTLVLLLKQTTR
jgi:hypothetical protein